MTIRDIAVAFGFEIDRNSERQAENSINSLKNFATKALDAVKVVFSIAGLMELEEAAANAEALKSQFTQVFGGIEDVAGKKLQAVSDETGVAVNRMKGSFSQIAAFAKVSGVGQKEALELSERAIKAVTDSAAYYDRTIEETTESLQSFLKGNFENDAALGLSCTETTRNAAANALYSKSFKDLSEAEKQFTLLKMVEDANRLSGALGQAARESDTWTNQLGNLKQSLQDLKAAGGSVILKPGVMVLKILIALTNKATEGITKLTGENGFLTRSLDRTHALVKKLHPAIGRMTESFSNGLDRGTRIAGQAVERLGGIDNVLKILVMAATAFLAAMNWGRAISAVKGLASVLSGIGKMFGFANLKALALVAVFLILALAIDDFVNFLQGNDSVIGTIFDNAGIGAENARKAITNTWNNIKIFLSDTWDTIKEGASMFTETIKGFFERHADSAAENFVRAWGIIKGFLSGAWTFISQLASTIFGTTEENIGNSTENTKSGVLGTWQEILDTLSSVLDALYGIFDAVFNSVASVIEAVFGALKSFWDSWGNEVLAFFKTLWDCAGQILDGFLDVIKGVADFISSVFASDWQGAWQAVLDIFSGIWEMVSGIFTAAWEGIQLVLEIGLEIIQSLWEAVWGSISNFFTEIWNNISSFLSEVWSNITSTISDAINNAYAVIQNVLVAIRDFFSNIFNSVYTIVMGIFSNLLSGITNTIGSIRDTVVNGISSAVEFIKGLPSQAVQWGSDFIGGLKNGIMSGVQGIVDAVSGIGGRIKSFLHFSVPDEGPLTDYESWMPDFMEGLAEGIEDNSGKVLDKVKGLASGIAEFIGNTDASGIASRVKSAAGSIARLLRFKIPAGSFPDGIMDNIAGISGQPEENVDIGGTSSKAGPDKSLETVSSYPYTDNNNAVSAIIESFTGCMRDNQDKIINETRNLAAGIAILADGAHAKAGTVATGTVNNTTSSNITQNVNINNSYTGTITEAGKQITKTMEKSAEDVTSYMARGLAFARG